jgi:hypothetical protein
MSTHFRTSLVLMSTFAVTLGVASAGRACTTAVISGKATAGGRPILWKNRDINTPKNEVVHLTNGKYPVTALVNAGSRKSIWMGVNSAGLCIENSVTKDLAKPDGVKGPGNGDFMLLALQNCATVEEVKKLLEETDKTGRSTNANFGVIDAHGGAALFETSRIEHVMYDANDPETAPEGIVVRSNFSMTGQGFTTRPTPEMLAEIYSGGRYRRACDLILPAAGRLDVKWFVRNCARDLSNAQCVPHPGTVNGPAGSLPEFIATKNTISRTTTVSFAVFQGVKPGEDPLLTTMWLGLGDPKFSIALPFWVATESVAEEFRGAQGGPLCQASIALREQFYSKDEDVIRTAGLPAVWQTFWPFEDELLSRVDRKLVEWRTSGIDRESMRAIHVSSAEQALALVQGMLRTPVPAEEAAVVPVGAGN